MDKDMKGWFTEINDLWAGQAMSLQVDEILHHEKSRYQDILVFNRCVQMDSTLQMRIISNHLPFPSYLLTLLHAKTL